MRKPLFIQSKDTVYYNMDETEEDYGQFYILDEFNFRVETMHGKNTCECECEDEDEDEDYGKIENKSFSNLKHIYFQRTLCVITVFAALIVFMKFA
jgi:hypothetical protein